MNSYPNSFSRKFAFGLTLALFAVTAASAFAHPAHGLTSSFTPGLLHPLSGWDHALAMLAVGMWAAQIGAPRVLPGTFLVTMVFGAVLGRFSGMHPGIDQGIAASVLVLGLLVAWAVRLSPAVAAAVVAAFALFHGWAHGSEMPATGGGLAYGAGFILSTALLLGCGVAIGSIASRRPPIFRTIAGSAIALAGIALIAG